MKILRFEIEKVAEEVEIYLPPQSSIVHFNYQDSRAFFSIWAMCNDSEFEWDKRTFIVVPTGMEVASNGIYVGTIKMSDNFHMFHCFEIFK